MNTKKILALVLMLVLICTLAACGAKDDVATVEPKNAEEAVAMHEDLHGTGKCHFIAKYRPVGKGLPRSG